MRLSENTEVAALWHPTLNGDLTPEDVSSGSGKDVWWLCPTSGAPYRRRVSGQIRSGVKTPYTSGSKVLAGYNDLSTTHPDVAALWHPTLNGDLTPQKVSAGSSKKVWWLCPESNGAYERKIPTQVNCKGRSPYTTGQNVMAGYNDLGSKHPNIAALWHPSKNGELTPKDVYFGSDQKVWWVCSDTQEPFQRSVAEHIRSKGKSPYMTGRKVLQGYNDVATTHPEIASLLHPTKNGDINEHNISMGNNKKLWWLCPDTGGEYQRTFRRQVRCSGVSPFISGKSVLVGHNDLATKKPDIAAHWHPTKNGDITPEMVTCGSRRKVWWLCPETGRDFHRKVDDAVRYGVLHPTVSSGEIAIFDFICDLGVNPIHSDRKVISPLELDIVIPDRKIAIEYNGLYWHSESAGRGRRYHHNKWSSAQEAGYQLITIWEDDWRDRPEVVKSMLARKLGVDDSPTVGARKCSVVKLTKHECADLLEQHHIQGFASGSVYLGLKDRDNTLVAASSWTKNGTDLRLDRFATSCKVPGGMGKLLKAAQKWCDNNGCTRIVTFSDHEVSNGALYDRLGFIREAELAPDYKYVQGGVRKHKFGFRLKKFRTDPTLQYRDGLTERELAELNGLVRVWDCGKTRHVLTWDQSSAVNDDGVTLFSL